MMMFSRRSPEEMRNLAEAQALKDATVTSRRQDEIDAIDPDFLGAADFYIVVPTDFPTSY